MQFRFMAQFFFVTLPLLALAAPHADNKIDDSAPAVTESQAIADYMKEYAATLRRNTNVQ